MILTLEISGPEAAKLGATSRKVFNAAAGRSGAWPITTGCCPIAMCRLDTPGFNTRTTTTT